MLFADLALARRLEGVDAAKNAEYAEAHARLRPDTGATARQLAGGWVVYAGVDSPMTQAVGLGLAGPVSEAELDEVEDFFRRRGAPVYVELCPLADESLLSLLGARRYRLVEQTNKLFRPLAAGELFSDPASGADVQVRSASAGETEMWARTVATGFAGDERSLPLMLEVTRTSLGMRATRQFIAEIGGEAVGGGSLLLHEGVAGLAGTSVLPRFRNRGVQGALIRARLELGAARGCDLAAVTTLPGTSSQRNVERHGFHVAYTRAKLFRE